MEMNELRGEMSLDILVNIYSDNDGLSPIQCGAIAWTNADVWSIGNLS